MRKTAQRSSWWLACTISVALHALLLLVLVAWARWCEHRPASGGGPFNNVVEASLDLDVRLELPGSAALVNVAAVAASPVSGPLAPAAIVKPMPKSSTGPARINTSQVSTHSSHGRSGGPTRRRPAVLHIASTCRRVVFVLDRSLSMGLHGGLDAARQELEASLQTLKQDRQFQIVAYNRAWALLLPDAGAGLVSATLDNQTQAVHRLSALTAEGRTDHVPALKAALRLEPDVIFWLTDADDFRAEEVRAIAQYNHRHIPICPITVLSAAGQPANPPLQALARMTGGSYAVLGQPLEADRQTAFPSP